MARFFSIRPESAAPVDEPDERNQSVLRAPTEAQVGSLARAGAMWTVSVTIANQFIGVIATAVLARLLLPSDYGIMGMVATLTALIGAVSGMGLSWATIQRKDLTLAQVHNLFWINATSGAVFWLIAVGVAPALAAFYDTPEVAPVTMALGGSFLLSGLAAQPGALLQRRMNYRATTQLSVLAQFVGAVVAVVLASLGLGYWALVWQGLVSQGVRMTLAFAFSGYRPGRPSRDPRMMGMMTFGGYLMLSSVVTYFGRNTDNILIGRTWGTEALGYYSRAYFLMTLPTMLFASSMTGVMVPALSALSHDRERMGTAYRSAVRAIAFAGYPIAIGLLVTAPETVRLVYGPRWGPVVPVLAWLAIAMISQIVSSTNGWLYTAVGEGRQLFLVGAAATALTVIAIAVGNIWGPTSVAGAYATLSVLLTVPLMWLAHRAASLQIGVTLTQMRPILGSALVMGAVSWLAGGTMEKLGASWIWVVTAKVAVGTLVYIALCLWLVTPWPVSALERGRVSLLARFGLHDR